MMTFSLRRCINTGVFLVLAALVVAAYFLLTLSTYPTAYASGWLLLSLVVVLACYNVRKKLTFFPIGDSSTWLQFHIYAGWLTFVVFAIHVGFRIPNGAFEVALALVYLSVALSGVLGLILSRMIPRRLTARGQEVLYERIPLFIRSLREEVEEAVVNCITETDSTAVPEFYASELKPFFEGPRHFWRHVVLSTRPRRDLLGHIEAQYKFLNATERELMGRLADRVRVKDDLDYHYAMQTVMKYWLFVHIPLTYVLLVLAAFHMLLVYAFSGGPE